MLGHGVVLLYVYNARQCFLNSLETSHFGQGDSIENRVVLVKSRANNRTCDSVCSLLVCRGVGGCEEQIVCRGVGGCEEQIVCRGVGGCDEQIVCRGVGGCEEQSSLQI